MQIILIIAVIWYFFFRKKSKGFVKPMYGNNYNTITMEESERLSKELFEMTKQPVPDAGAIIKKLDGLNNFDFSVLSYNMSNIQKGFVFEEWIRINLPKNLDYFKYNFSESF
ncbi:hypothetical protein [Flavobacterium microcysteis]|uniref:Uncharacterized protein n=1 Tax=Flavobacterium microcysteis TaxID=2596891 RepID=A0A501QDQ3_9FLAO|nr:hypothetical protein [Flavobacterium microcysteis]TPD70504.1 hypothetical protein FJA49_06090 [Flavobacterium microcysteis]